MAERRAAVKKPRKDQAVTIVSGRNCPFYGRSALAFPILVESRGNQCALILDSHAPCEMEVDGRVPDWRACEVYEDMLEPRKGRGDTQT